MSRLLLSFLGPPRVSLDGAAVELHRRKVLALLAYLAVTGRPHSRDELAELLYGKLDRERGRANFRQCLSFLGRAIGEEHIGADRLTVWLPACDGLCVDVVDYRRLTQSARAADGRGDLSAAQAGLVEAIALYRGEFLSSFFLPDGAAFEAWQLEQQESLRREQAAALERLVGIHAARGQYQEALDCGRRWLALDPLEEGTHRQLMLLHALAGERSEALRQYERCRSVLERELGETPGEETEGLREQIASRKPLPGGGRAPASGDSGPSGPESAPGCRLLLFARIASASESPVARLETRLRELFAAARGQLLEATGRTLCAICPTAWAAVDAAIGAQAAAGEAGGTVRVVLLAGKTTSSALAERAGMLLEASHAGQVLLDDPAAVLAGRTALPAGATVRRLGAYRLRDLGPAQTIHQLGHPSLPREFAPLVTLDSRPNNLGIQPTPFVGREEQLEAVREALLPEDARLLTLVGAAGTGKTRLALQAAAALADRFEQGVFLVDLAALREPGQVVTAIAAALDLREAGGSDRPLLDMLKHWLGNRQVLLLLDNFEHLLPAAAVVADLLAFCPRLKVLATSREALRLRAERAMAVPPMRLPSQGQRVEVMRRSEAVRLFANRAEAARPDFVLDDESVETVSEICIRLDGLPLAIELAATRVRSLAPSALLARLADRLGLLTQGPRDLPARQQTLRSELDWSHELLSERERRVLRRVAVFPGGCALEGAEAACRAAGEDVDVLNALTSLADKSLIRLGEAAGEPRFRMLETIREYARERLEESGEVERAAARGAAYLLRFAERAEPALYGPDQARWLDRIESDYDNMRAALARFRDREAREEGLRLAGALGWFWFRRGRFTEAQDWLERFRSAALASDPPGPRAKVAYYLGWMKACVGRSFWANPEGKAYFGESLGLWREAGNRRGTALSQAWLGCIDGVEDADSWALADESVAIARDTGDPWATAFCLKMAYSHLRRQDKDLASRRAALEEAVALAREAGDPFLLCQTLGGMGHVYGWIGELHAAEPWYLESLRVAHEIDEHLSILDAMNCLGDLYLGLGEIRKAREHFTDGLRLASDLGARAYLAWFIGGLYGVARQEGRTRRAVRLGAASEALLDPGSTYDPRLAQELGLDDEAAREEWRIGQFMTPEQAVGYALSEE